MFKNIMVPVDTQNLERLEKVFELASELAKKDGATLHLVHVGMWPPSSDGRTVEEQNTRIDNLGREIATKYKVPVEAQIVRSHDPAAEMNGVLMNSIKDTHADLVVVGSHVPKIGDYFFTSHGGYLAEHAEISVFVVRNT